ncbi:MAG: SMI1/KNR4 family protein [Chloroflexaceae bacterium]|nr:SMI1/KNR4 family protein [Chloroflexaceae bacterium]
MHLHTILDKLLDYAERTQPDIRSVMQPGLDAATIWQRVPLALPNAVVELYQWQNGMRDEERIEEHTLFSYHHFLSLEHAIDTYLELQRINSEIGSVGYPPELFPLFTFQGEYYAVWTDIAHDDFGSISFDYHGHEKVYDNLASMLNAILECYETGGYNIQDNDIEPDKQSRSDQSKMEYVPCSYRRYHPW